MYDFDDTMVERLAEAITGRTIDALRDSFGEADDNGLANTFDDAVMELDTIDRTIAHAIKDRKAALQSEIAQLNAVQSDLEAGRTISAERCSLSDEAITALAGREDAIAALTEQLSRLRRHGA